MKKMNKQVKVNAQFKRARKFIRAGKVEMALEVLSGIQTDYLNGLARHEESGDEAKKELFQEVDGDLNPVEKYIERIETDSKTPKITYAPHTGRITVKIPQTASDIERKVYLELADKLIKDDEEENIQSTLRGSPVFSMYYNHWWCILTSKSGQRKIVTI